MKKLIFILITVVLISCNENKRTTSSSSGFNGQDTVSADVTPPGDIQKERDALQIEKSTAVTKSKDVASVNGKYRKLVKNQPAADCNCNCIDISFDTPTEWCIDKDKMYITARCQKTGDNTADIYLVGPSREINPDKPLPWADFDTDFPVATVTFQPDGSAELDWLGFAVNGEVATEYALYGKKTLEGTYQKE